MIYLIILRGKNAPLPGAVSKLIVVKTQEWAKAVIQRMLNADLFSVCLYLFIETESLSCKIINAFQKWKAVNMTYFSISLSVICFTRTGCNNP